MFLANFWTWYNFLEFVLKITQLIMAWHKSLPKISVCLNVHGVINHNSVHSAHDNGGFFSPSLPFLLHT